MPSGFITFIEDNTGFYFDTQTQTDDSTGDITGEIVWSGSPYTMYSFYAMAYAGNGNINSFKTCPSDGNFVPGSVTIHKGDVWFVKTAQGKFAKVHIEDYIGDYGGGNCWVRVYYVYNPSGDRDF